MVGNLLLRVSSFLFRRRLLFFVLLSALVIVLSFGISRLRLSENILATLPKGKSFDEFNRLISNKNLSNQIVFSLDVAADQDADSIRNVLSGLTDSLYAAGNGLIGKIVAQREDAQQETYQYMLDHFPELIDSTYFRFISSKTEPDSIRASLQNAFNRLSTPEGAFLKDFILNDPLFITSAYFTSLNHLNNSTGLRIEDGLLFDKERTATLFTASLTFDSGNSSVSTQLYRSLEAFCAEWNQAHPQNKLLYFGTFEIAARNAIQIKRDATLTMTISLVLIIGLLIFFYRKWLIPFYILLPAVFGGVFAIGLIGFIRPGISGISLATGAILLGIALDYSIHFFTHLKHVKSIDQTIRDIAQPLITGSLTTILAYGALLFAESSVLQDFGLFAALSLTGAMFFTLIVLPGLLKIIGFDNKAISDKTDILHVPDLPRKWSLPLAVTIVVLTIFFYWKSSGVKFDGEMENMSVHSQDLKQTELKLTGIDPKTQKKIYAFTTGETAEISARANLRLYEEALQLSKTGKVSSTTSLGMFMLPDSVSAARRKTWNSYWAKDGKLERTIRDVRVAASDAGFSSSAFAGYEEWLRNTKNADTSGRAALLHELGLDNLIEVKDGTTTYITTLVIPKSEAPSVIAKLRDVPGVEIFDRSELAASLLEVVKNDFNFILLFSASIVFVALLLLYGRIELAILSFLPMAISWIWILGLTALLDIQFNFINVVIATFIFGLGDDFSIFMTDGLLHKYKYGRNNLGSYRSAISISGLTTLIGTGVLFFAEHPALKSIAVVSVPGIVCIIFISLVFQPILFNLFVQNRVDNGKPPVTMLTFLMTTLDFVWFIFACGLVFLAMIVTTLLPLPMKSKRQLVNRFMSLMARSVIYSGLHVKKRFIDLGKLNLQEPRILIANHTSFLDIMLVMMLHPRAVLMVKQWVHKSPLFGWVIRYANYVSMEEGSEANLEQMKKLISDGYSVVIFPEGTRSTSDELNRFRKGAFYLADELSVPIQPVLIFGAHNASPKGELIIKPSELSVKVLAPIRPEDRSWGNELRDRSKNIGRFFKEEFNLFRDQMSTPDYLKRRVFNNYVFKGPVLEWYFRIKWELEKQNYAGYDRQIGDKKRILDVGCGYGYLSFYLHYRNPDRVITGVDYDAEKIAIAQNSFDKTGNLQFTTADINAYRFVTQDIIFLNDVLHYMSAEKQLSLLQKCTEALTPGGILYVRDGITDQDEQHERTRTTEKLSTGLFGFNRKVEDLHFFSSRFMLEFARKNNLSAEMISHSDSTSNVLFVLKKPNLFDSK